MIQAAPTAPLFKDEKSAENTLTTIRPVFQDITRIEAVVSSGDDYLVAACDSIGYVYSLHGISQETFTNEMFQENIPGLKLVHTLDRFKGEVVPISSAITCLCSIDMFHVSFSRL
jgi:hypothetical protein